MTTEVSNEEYEINDNFFNNNIHLIKVYESELK